VVDPALLNKVVQKAQHNNLYSARLGDGNGNLLIDNRPGYVWALVNLPGGQSQCQVINNSTSNILGLNVFVSRNKNGELEVICSDPAESTSFYTGFHVSPDTPQHGQRHGYYGDDPVIVEGLQFNPLRTRLLSSTSTSVYVEDFYYKYGDETKWWPGGSIDLSDHIPDVNNKQRFVVVGLNKDTNELELTAEDVITYSVSDITYVPFTGQDVKALALDADIEPSAAVRLYYGQTSLDLRDIFFDCRHYLTPRITPNYVFPEPTTLTISSGAVTITQSTHIIAAESGTSDNLDTITTSDDYVLLLLQADTGDTITLTESGNITLNGQDTVRFIADSEIMLFYDGTKWQLIGVVANNHVQFTALDIEDTSAVIRSQLLSDGGAIFNETGADADFRIESNTDTHCFYLDGGNDAVTIGSSTKLGKFGVDGVVDEVQLAVRGHSTQTNLLSVWENDSGNDQITFSGTGGAVFNEAGNAVDFRVESDNNANMFKVEGATDRVGFGVDPGYAQIEVAGTTTDYIEFLLYSECQSTLTTAHYGFLIRPAFNPQGASLSTIYGSLYIAQISGSALTITNTFAQVNRVDLLAGFSGVATNVYLYAGSTPTIAGGAITNLYGLYLYDMNVGTTLNYAIYTNAGLNRLGDQLMVDGSADRTQLLVQAHSTQTSLLAVFEDSAGNDQVTISGDGAVVINEEGNDADFRVEGNTEDHLLTVDAGDDVVRLGDWDTNYSQFAKNGDQTFVGSAGFYPRRVSQNAEPANGTGADQIDVGELIIWRDADDNQVWLMYQDTDEGIVKVELT
jgi:hypothetical protein